MRTIFSAIQGTSERDSRVLAPLVLQEKAEEGVMRPGARPGAGCDPTGVPQAPGGRLQGEHWVPQSPLLSIPELRPGLSTLPIALLATARDASLRKPVP